MKSIRGTRLSRGLAPVLLMAIAWLAVQSRPAAQAQQLNFEQQVLPLLRNRCGTCHGQTASGGLNVLSLPSLMTGGRSGASFVAGNPNDSLLIKRITGVIPPRMPRNGAPLSEMEIDLLRRWVTQQAQAAPPALAPGGGAARGGGTVPTGVSDAAQPLAISEPRDGQEVREKVRVVVPHNSLPSEGFVAIYVDNEFQVGLAGPPLPVLGRRPAGDPAAAPAQNLTYEWDSKVPLSIDRRRAIANVMPPDGTHTIEVRSYSNSGAEVERARVQVNLSNQIPMPATQPIRLAYGADIGDMWRLNHEVDLRANAAEGARVGGVRAAGPSGQDDLSSLEKSAFLISLEDIEPRSFSGFWRERRESPLELTTNNQRQLVALTSSSRYFMMNAKGEAERSKTMEREDRWPVMNPLELPGGPVLPNRPFSTRVKVHLGAYIPTAISVDGVQAAIEGLEWEGGQRCARIVCTYNSAEATLTVYNANIRDAAFGVQQGKTTVWFAYDLGRVMRVEHDVRGMLKVSAAQQLGPSVAGGGGMYGGGGGLDPVQAEILGLSGGGGGGSPYPGGGGAYGGAGGGAYGGGGALDPVQAEILGLSGGGGSSPYPGGGGAYGGGGGAYGGGAPFGPMQQGSTGITPQTRDYYVVLNVKTRAAGAGSR